MYYEDEVSVKTCSVVRASRETLTRKWVVESYEVSGKSYNASVFMLPQDEKVICDGIRACPYVVRMIH